jgi:methionyl-tRNA formyltransferase
MKQRSARVIFFGNERLATGVTTNTPLLRALLANGYDVVAVVAHHEAGKSRKTRKLEIAEIAAAHSIPLLLPEKLSAIREQLEELRPDIAVLAAYGKIVPQSVIDLFPGGIINIHPSLLPEHRGPTPIESVILDGSPVTGVSLMQLVKDMDAGPIYAQAELALEGHERKQQLADNLLEIGEAMLIELLPGILAGHVVAKPQEAQAASYDKQISKHDGFIDWRKPARQLEREIRAFQGWPQSRAWLGDLEVIVTQAHTLPASSARPGHIEILDNSLTITCGENALVIDALKPAGKPEMPSKAFLAGYASRIGTKAKLLP